MKKENKIEPNNDEKLLNENIEEKQLNQATKLNKRLVYFITFFSGLLFIISSYAWFSASLDVKIKFFDLKVSTNNGLFVSLDGIDFSDSIEISKDTVINDLKQTYPNHKNQWATNGLRPVSTTGIRTPNDSVFDIYKAEVSSFKYRETGRKFINSESVLEEESNALNLFIAFDIFFKNVSGSPKSDNLFFDEGTLIEIDADATEEVKTKMEGIINSTRFGIVKIGSVDSKSPINIVQNISCNNNCESAIYEPYNLIHSETSILKAEELNINLTNGSYINTYALKSEGKFLDYVSGYEGTGVPLDTDHFAKQETMIDFENPVFQIPNAITKARVYIWIEGQDVDGLEANSEAGADLFVSLNFTKDLAGYK